MLTFSSSSSDAEVVDCAGEWLLYMMVGHSELDVNDNEGVLQHVWLATLLLQGRRLLSQQMRWLS